MEETINITEKSANTKENRSDRFRRVMTNRVNRVIEQLRLVGNCSNTSAYSYTEDEVNQVFDRLQLELDMAKSMFNIPSKRKPAAFEFAGAVTPELKELLEARPPHSTIALVLDDDDDNSDASEADSPADENSEATLPDFISEADSDENDNHCSFAGFCYTEADYPAQNSEAGDGEAAAEFDESWSGDFAKKND